MPARRTVVAATWGACLVLGLSACSGDASPTAGASAQAREARTARIYVVAPQTGTDAALGLGTAHSVELAVKQAVERNTIPGWKLEVTVLDDKGEKTGSAEAAKKAVADDDTVAVIGSIFSGLTLAMQDTLTQAGMPHVSPTASNPTLTKGADYVNKPRRLHPNFFRIIPPDDAHAPALVRFLREKGVARVAVVHDGDSYGSGLATAFTTAFTKAGGQVLSTDTVDPTKPARFPALVKKLVASKPQAVMYGGNDPQAGPLSQQLKAAGLIVPLAGGDGIGTEMYTVRAGALSAGDVSTAGGHPLADVPQGRQYLADYKAAGILDDSTAYGPLGYDAAGAVIAALKTSLPTAASAKDSRAATIKALAGVSLDGATGRVAFDSYGDITPRVVTVNTLVGGRWSTAKTYDLG